MKKISELYRLLVDRYRVAKLAKTGILPLPSDVYKKSRSEPFELKFVLVVGPPTINIHRKFQLNRFSHSSDIVVTKGWFSMMMDFARFRKNSIKNQRFKFF